MAQCWCRCQSARHLNTVYVAHTLCLRSHYASSICTGTGNIGLCVQPADFVSCQPQVGFSVVIFVLLGSEDGFSTEWKHDAEGHKRAPALYNALFSTIAFLLGAITSIISGFLGAASSDQATVPIICIVFCTACRCSACRCWSVHACLSREMLTACC